MAAAGSNISVEACSAGDARNEQVQGSVAVDIATGKAAIDTGFRTKRPILRRKIAEAAAAVIGKQLIALGVAAPKRPQSGNHARRRTGQLRTRDTAVDH